MAASPLTGFEKIMCTNGRQARHFSWLSFIFSTRSVCKPLSLSDVFGSNWRVLLSRSGLKSVWLCREHNKNPGWK
jgi:hypothetical protein